MLHTMGSQRVETRLMASIWQIKFTSLSGLPKFVFLHVSSNRLGYSFIFYLLSGRMSV